MNHIHTSGNPPEETPIIERVGDAIENLRIAIREATEIILTQRRKPFEPIDNIIQDHRMSAIHLLRYAEEIYKEEERNHQILALMGEKIGYSMNEYEFYTFMADIFESENDIKKLEKWIQETPLFGRMMYNMLSLCGHNRKQFLQQHLHDQIDLLVSDIDTFLENPHCDQMNTDEREYMNLKWKYYTRKIEAMRAEFSGPSSS